MKILLTTVFRPFGVENKYNKKGDEFLLDYLASRLTKEPGLFSLSSYVPNSGLHLIAANLPVETKVMENPTLEEFIYEIKKGYDFVGISFLIKGFRKVFRMISLTRKHSPDTKIVIGGFGTGLHNMEDLGADYICEGEGVQFMRKLLGFPSDAKMIHPAITADVTLKVFQDYGFIEKAKMGLLTSGFGCPNACEFCCTSAYFGHKHIPFMKNGGELYQAMRYMYKNANISRFLIFEEDFLLYRKTVKELGRLIREDRDHHFTFACFASIKSISGYDLEELVSMGLGHVWIGIESIEPPFKKRYGRDIEDTFQQLHALGVTTTGSVIFGLDHHTPENLPAEVDFVINLSPSTVQLSNLMAAEGTPLRERLEKENRIRKIGFKDADLYSEIIEHPSFRTGEIPAAINTGYERLYNTIGPSLFRILKTWLSGYTHLKHSRDPVLRKRAEGFEEMIKGVYPVFLNTRQYLPNDDVSRQVQATLNDVFTEFGPPGPKQINSGKLMGKIFDLEATKKEYLEPKPIEPPTLITRYDSRFFEDSGRFFNE
jgi:haloalkane dehalogenase